MKKYLLGMLAIVLAVGFSAFTKPAKKPVNQYIFYYQLGTFSQAQVEAETVASWGTGTLYTSSLQECDNTNEKACAIVVEQSKTLNDAGQELDPAEITIVADRADPSGHSAIYRVASSSANLVKRSNQLF